MTKRRACGIGGGESWVSVSPSSAHGPAMIRFMSTYRRRRRRE